MDSEHRHVIRAACAGDRLAFTELIRTNHRQMRTLAYRVAPADCDDVLQEAYLQAFQAIHRFHGDERAFRSWLAKIVYNKALSSLRSRSRQGAAQAASATPAVVPAPREAAVAGAIKDLAPDVRAALVLVHVFGFDYREAARILDVPPGTIGSRIHRARAELRAALLARTTGDADA
jgi:RNA polymerase sigma-70 factor, ECF subfamily